MTAIVLRTLARKSVLGFGKNADYSVQQMLDMKHHMALRWYYYNCSMISFMPDILDEIGITEEWRIDKPGKDPEKGRMLDEEKDKNYKLMLGRINDLDENGVNKAIKIDAKRKAQNRKRARREYRSFAREDNSYFSKGAMQRRNHGHK